MTLNLWRVVLTLVIAAHGIGHLFFLVPTLGLVQWGFAGRARRKPGTMEEAPRHQDREDHSPGSYLERRAAWCGRDGSPLSAVTASADPAACSCGTKARLTRKPAAMMMAPLR